MGIFKNDDPKVYIIKSSIQKWILEKVEEGLEWLIVSGQLGVELWAGEAVVDLRNSGHSVKLGVLLPYKNFGEKWKEPNRQLLEKLKTQADFCEYSSKKDYYSPDQLRGNQDFILKNTDGCLMVYDVEHEGKAGFLYKRVLKKQKNSSYVLNLITFDTLEETAREEEEKRQFEQEWS